MLCFDAEACQQPLMRGEQPADPGCRGAGFCDLGGQVDEHCEILLIPAEGARLYEFEEADLAQRAYVLRCDGTVFLRRGGARFECGCQLPNGRRKPLGIERFRVDTTIQPLGHLRHCKLLV